jgi:hypothetical protein
MRDARRGAHSTTTRKDYPIGSNRRVRLEAYNILLLLEHYGKAKSDTIILKDIAIDMKK